MIVDSYFLRISESNQRNKARPLDVADMKKWDYSETWYHGSPYRLTTLRKGSTITQDRNLARVFSHKPTNVSISVHVGISDEGIKYVSEEIKHDGKMRGFLYRIAEDIKPEDVYPHPRSSMEMGKEWLTNRELRVELIGPTQIVDDERLTEEDILELEHMRKTRSRGKTEE